MSKPEGVVRGRLLSALVEVLVPFEWLPLTSSGSSVLFVVPLTNPAVLKSAFSIGTATTLLDFLLAVVGERGKHRGLFFGDLSVIFEYIDNLDQSFNAPIL